MKQSSVIWWYLGIKNLIQGLADLWPLIASQAAGAGFLQMCILGQRLTSHSLALQSLSQFLFLFFHSLILFAWLDLQRKYYTMVQQ